MSMTMRKQDNNYLSALIVKISPNSTASHKSDQILSQKLLLLRLATLPLPLLPVVVAAAVVSDAHNHDD